MIKCEVVPNTNRMKFLPKHVGLFMTRLETSIYDWMVRLDKAYTGDYWEFYELDNGGFFLAPSEERDYKLCSINHNEEVISNISAGITVTLFALNSLMVIENISDSMQEILVNKYYALRDFASDCDEAAKIFSLID